MESRLVTGLYDARYGPVLDQAALTFSRFRPLTGVGHAVLGQTDTITCFLT